MMFFYTKYIANKLNTLFRTSGKGLYSIRDVEDEISAMLNRININFV